MLFHKLWLAFVQGRDRLDSLKNIGLSAAGDLGLGQQLQQSVADNEEELRKKKLLQQASNPSAFGDLTLNPMNSAAGNLFGGSK